MLAEENLPKNLKAHYYFNRNEVTKLPNTTGKQETVGFDDSIYHQRLCNCFREHISIVPFLFSQYLLKDILVCSSPYFIYLG